MVDLWSLIGSFWTNLLSLLMTIARLLVVIVGTDIESTMATSCLICVIDSRRVESLGDRTDISKRAGV